MATFSKGTKTLAVKETLGRCGYCAIEIVAYSCELDHVVPRSKNGTNSRKNNLVAACVKCNRLKSAMSIGDFKKKIKIEQFWFEVLSLTKGEIHVLNRKTSLRLKAKVFKSVKVSPYEVQ